jgi:hypothetical protein
MRARLTHACLGVFAAIVLAAPAAHAFTMENGDPSNPYAVPKFDLEEQSKNFRKDGTDPLAAGKSQFDTPVGKLQFGVGPSTGFGSGFSGLGGLGPADGARASRLDMDRMLAPPGAQFLYDNR